jgi:AcrR family transcriptional regulator
MAPRVSDEYLEARRQQILEAAERCFSRYGLHEATLERIRLEAGLSRGAVYHYFRSKEGIVDAMRSADLEADAAMMPPVAPGAERKNLTDFVTTMIERMGSPASMDANRVGVMLWGEALINERLLEGQLRVMDTGVRDLEAVVAQAQEDGAITEDLSARAIADFLLAAMMGIQIQYIWRPDIGAERLAEVLQVLLTGSFWTGESPSAG